MAAERTVECPECGTERVTRAQPRTRLRCRSCDAHYLTPPLHSAPDPDPDPDPAGGNGDVSVEGDNFDLGPPVERVDSVEFPTAPVAPDARQPRGAQQSDSGNAAAVRETDQDLEDLDLADPPSSPDPEPVAERPAPGSSASAKGGGSPNETPSPPPPTPADRPSRRRRYGRW